MYRNTVGWECAALGISSSLQPLLSLNVPLGSCWHQLTAQGAGLPGHLLLPADQWLPEGMPYLPLQMTRILGSQGSQS